MNDDAIAEENHMEVVVLGRTLGTASGWGGDPGDWIVFYDFKPAEGIDLPAMESLNIDWNTGHIGSLDEDGNMCSSTKDLVEFLAGVKRNV